MEYLTIQEVAKKLRVNHTTVARWIKKGALEAVPLPHQNKRTIYRVPASALDKILNRVAA